VAEYPLQKGKKITLSRFRFVLFIPLEKEEILGILEEKFSGVYFTFLNT
jgi:hypothetical protein